MLKNKKKINPLFFKSKKKEISVDCFTWSLDQKPVSEKDQLVLKIGNIDLIKAAITFQHFLVPLLLLSGPEGTS